THPHPLPLPCLAYPGTKYDDARPRRSGALSRGKQTMTSQPMAPAVIDELLDRLSSDDAFRALFASDPRAALATIGYAADAADPLLCAQTTVLASKAEIAAARDALRAHLGSTAIMSVIFNFEAGRIGES